MKHKITNENITSHLVEENIKRNYPNGVDICYTDPPWGNGNLSYWKTINKKMTSAESDLISQEEMEDRISYLITKYVKTYAFIVYGKREAESLTNKLKKYPNVKDVQYIKKRYQSGSKWLENCVLCVTLNDAPVKSFQYLENQDGLKGLEIVCKEFQGVATSVLELFVGVGFYLKVLDKYGFEVVGNELNGARLSKALDKVK
jgi:hypothetical protein